MTELADTSAWVWSRKPGHGELRYGFDAALVEGELATCDMVRLELLSSARNPNEFAEIREELGALDDCPIGKEQWVGAGAVGLRAAQQPGWVASAVGQAPRSADRRSR